MGVGSNTRSILRNRDLVSAVTIGTLGLVRAVQRRTFRSSGEQGTFKARDGLWGRGTWALRRDHTGRLVQVGSRDNSVLIEDPPSLRRLCAESGVLVPWRYVSWR